MSRRGIVNSLVAAVAILVTGGLAAQAVVRGPSTSGDSELVAAGVDGRGSFAIDSQASTNDTRPTASTRPRPSTTTFTPPTVPLTTPPATDTTLAPAPDTTVAATTPPPPFIPPNLPPDLHPQPPPPPPVLEQTGPASWKFVDQGVTITASVSPVEPRVGDTVTISFTTGGEPENCCRAVVFVGSGVDSKMVGYTLRTAADPCQPPGPISGTGSIVASEPGPLTFDVEATRDPAGCDGPFIFTNVSLAATVQVLPALPAA